MKFKRGDIARIIKSTNSIFNWETMLGEIVIIKQDTIEGNYIAICETDYRTIVIEEVCLITITPLENLI